VGAHGRNNVARLNDVAIAAFFFARSDYRCYFRNQVCF